MPDNSFLIYNASAGSGKTFTLVKSYLFQILRTSRPDSYKHLLAITFTNKAVAEMKNRIISQLNEFSQPTSVSNLGSMMRELSEALDLSPKQIQERSKTILNHLLHHYASFSVETIDSFNHRLIRTFSRELKIASNFEVSLDTDLLMQIAVDKLIARSGTDKELTELLTDFTLQKTEEDKSWDIAWDIRNSAKNLFKESEYDQLEPLLEVPIKEYRSLSDKIRKKRDELSSKISEFANTALGLIKAESIPFDAFSSSTLPNHFEKLINGERKLYDNAYTEKIISGTYSYYPKKTSEEHKERIDAIADQLRRCFVSAKEMVPKERLLTKIVDQLIPMSVLSLVQQELKTLKEEDNILPITDFNRLISEEIRKQPAPYIYERLGERYRHYFIDEFQDTSVLQWTNLIPLIDNAISQEFEDGNPGSLLLVGDPKQSIYRWRGGVPEQFISLYNCHNPFDSGTKEVRNLKRNWRSRSEIIDFNNKFFSHIANVFSNEDHRDIYEIGNQQEFNELDGGYVNITFVPPERKKEDLDELYFHRTRDVIDQLLEKKYNYSDICILTRSNKDGISLGNKLADAKIPIVSSETLLLEHSRIVGFLVDCLKIKESQHNDDLAANALQFLHMHMNQELALHDFLSKYTEAGNVDLVGALSSLGKNFNYKEWQVKSMLESAEYLIHNFDLSGTDIAYLEGFMNLVFEYEQKQMYSELSFDEYWELKREKAAVDLGESMNAVRIMSIHKAKGLEFPVVIFPYADMPLKEVHKLNTWYDIEDLSEEIPKVILPVSKEMVDHSEQGNQLYNQLISTHEFDQINMLYVVLTRAIDQLYIFSKRPSSRNTENLNYYNALFKDYLQQTGVWEEGKDSYDFGTLTTKAISDEIDPADSVELDYKVSLPEDRQLHLAAAEAKIWRAQKDQAISKGSMLHMLMEHIRHKDDLPLAIQHFTELPGISDTVRSETISMAESIIADPSVESYFSDFVKVENERDLLTSDSRILRPDRINFNVDGSLTIIDYKTGKKEENHSRQLMEYSDALETMGYTIKERLIIYGNSDGILVNKV